MDRSDENKILSSSSIPTKHQRAVIRSQQKTGFSSQAKRFPSQDSLSESPGPGSYDYNYSTDARNPSFSKKGTTGFVPPKAARPFSYAHRGIPGPNVYNLQSSFLDKCDFNTGVSRVFRRPVAVQLHGPKHPTPAPNQYDIRCSGRERLSYVVGTSAFLSKTPRDSFCPNRNVPSPCHYDINKNITRYGVKAVSSPFKSKTQRIAAPVDHHVPGPGAYSPHQTPAPVRRTILPRGYYLAISAPPMIVPKDPPPPGPGQYDVEDHRGESKRPMPSAAFASKTERIPKNARAIMSPGPGFYDPQIVPKQSFFYNDSRVWIPV